MKATNINIGICGSRALRIGPSFFVNWQDENGNNYKYFSLRFAAENFKNNLIKSKS